MMSFKRYIPNLSLDYPAKAPLQFLLLLMLLLILPACSSPGRQLATGNQAFEEAEYEQAAQTYQGIVDADPLQPESLYNLANARYRQGVYTDTHQLLPVAAATGSEALATQSYFNQGNAHYQLQDWESAIKSYKETLRLNPGDGEAKYNLELAMRNIAQQDQEQQEQEQQEQDQEQQQEQDQEQDESSGGDQEEQQQQDGSEGEEEEQEEQQQGSDQAEQPQESDPQSADPQAAEPQEGLTEEQARQLLRAVGENTETLQEQIQMVVPADGAPPEKDW